MKIHHVFGLLAIICGQIGCGLYVTDGSEAQKASTTTVSTETVTGTNSSTTGSTTTETATTDPGVDGGGACVPELNVKIFDAASGDVKIGTKEFRSLSVTLGLSDCADLEVDNMAFILYSKDDNNAHTSYCADPCEFGDWNFGNAKLQEKNGLVAMGPSEFEAFKDGPSAVYFHDAFTMKAGTSKTLDVVFDIADPLKTNIVGKHFRVEFFTFGTSSINSVRTFDDQSDRNATFMVTQNSPTVTIAVDPFSAPTSAIVVPRSYLSQQFATYAVLNTGDTEQKLTQLTIEQTSINGDFADFHYIGIGGANGKWNGHLVDTLPAYPTNTITVDLSDDPLVLPPHSSTPLAVSGGMNDVVSSAACPSGHGCARSGHTLSLKVTSAIATDGNADVPAHTTAPMVLRQSQPFITKQELVNTTLVNADQDLLKFQVSADTTGPIGVKHFELVYTKSKEFSISDLRLRRGDTDMPLDSYRVLHGWPNPLDCKAGPCIDKVDNGVNSPLAIELVNEEFIQGSGVTYTLHGTVQDVAAESFLIFGFGWAGLDTNLTGCLTTLGDEFSLQTNGSNSGGNIFWSDLSETPHSSTTCDQGGSMDWTNGYLVYGMSESQTLSL